MIPFSTTPHQTILVSRRPSTSERHVRMTQTFEPGFFFRKQAFRLLPQPAPIIARSAIQHAIAIPCSPDVRRRALLRSDLLTAMSGSCCSGCTAVHLRTSLGLLPSVSSRTIIRSVTTVIGSSGGGGRDERCGSDLMIVVRGS